MVTVGASLARQTPLQRGRSGARDYVGACVKNPSIPGLPYTFCTLSVLCKTLTSVYTFNQPRVFICKRQLIERASMSNYIVYLVVSDL